MWRENHRKKKLNKLLQERITQYNTQEGEIAEWLQKDPDVPQKLKENDRKGVIVEIGVLEKIFAEISPYIRKIRRHISKVLAQNQITASYFIFGKIFQSWQAIFLLAKEGFHYEVIELLRSITESNDLIFLFMGNDGSSLELKKWFEGEIIGNEKARKAMDEFINAGTEKNPENKLPIGKMKADIYGVLSKYTHISYDALLDSFDVFHRDFDFDKIAGFCYTRKSLSSLKEELYHTVIALKYFYKKVGDSTSYGELNGILKRIPRAQYDE